MAVDKTTYKDNEYFVAVSYKDSSGEPTLNSVLDDDIKDEYITPLIHFILSQFEYLGIVSVTLLNEKSGPIIGFGESKFAEAIQKKLGRQFILAQAMDLYSMMTAVGVTEFVRNDTHPIWSESFEITDDKLNYILRVSSRDGNK